MNPLRHNLEDIIRQALQRASAADLIAEESEDMAILFRDNALQSVNRSTSEGIGLRLIREGRIGFASATSSGSAASLVEDAVAVSDYGERACFEFAPPAVYPGVAVYCEQIEDLTIPLLIELGQEMIERVRSFDPSISVRAQVGKGIRRVHLRNSCGLATTYKKSVFGFSAKLSMVRDGHIVQLFDGEIGCQYVRNHLNIAERLLEKAQLAHRVASPTRGQKPIIFSPRALSTLFQPLLTALSGAIYEKGLSTLGGKLGTPILGNQISLYDDGALAHAENSAPCDGEGVPSRRTALVCNGILVGLVYDLRTGAKAGRNSTGNGTRRFSDRPFPRCTTVTMEPGHVPLKEMISAMDEGLIIDDIMSGAGQGFSGDFSGLVSCGFKVERGHITGFVRDTAVKGNLYHTFRHILAPSQESQRVGNMQVPSILADAVDLLCQ